MVFIVKIWLLLDSPAPSHVLVDETIQSLDNIDLPNGKEFVLTTHFGLCQ